jgi:predicted metalloprotease with PDZ domain
VLLTCQLPQAALCQQSLELLSSAAAAQPQQTDSTDELPSPVNPSDQPTTPSVLGGSNGLEDPQNAQARAAAGQRAYLGLEAEELKGGGVGVRVSDVTRDSPAWKAGFQVNDRIIGVNGFAIAGMSGMVQQLGKARPGQTVTFLVTRDGRNLEMSATLINAEIARQETEAPEGTSGFAWMGASVHDLTQSFREQFGIAAYRGAAVTQVVPGSPAHLAGIRAGDAITEADGQPIETKLEYESWLEQTKPGDRVPLVIYRGITRIPTQVVLTGQPQPQPTPAWRRPSPAPRSAVGPAASDSARQPKDASESAQPTIAVPQSVPANASLSETPISQPEGTDMRVQELEAQMQKLREELAEAQAKLVETKKQLDSILRALKD